jgi:hypothetical protein
MRSVVPIAGLACGLGLSMAWTAYLGFQFFKIFLDHF